MKFRLRKGTLKPTKDPKTEIKLPAGFGEGGKVTLKEPRLHGYVNKRGEWKTIDQRELSARRARKTQKRGQAAVYTGGTVAGGAYLAGHDKGKLTPIGRRNLAWEQGHDLRGGAKLLRAAQGVPLSEKARYAAKVIRNKPLGAALLGGGTLAGVGAAGMIQGAAREGYHQSRINARRKANMSRSVGKRAPMDHESSGFARYGDGSTKGRRLPDEFSKALMPVGSALATHWGAGSRAMGVRATRKVIQAGKTAPHNSHERWEGNKAREMYQAGRKAPDQYGTFRTMGSEYNQGARLANIRAGKHTGIQKRLRNKDAEADRQRRLGMGVAAAGVGGALMLRRGVGGTIKTTRALRNADSKSQWTKMPDRARALVNHVDRNGNAIKGRGIAHTNKDLAYTAGGTLTASGALGLEHYSRGERNRRWE